MSAPDPYAAAFEMQRTAIEGARSAALGGITLSRTTTEAFVESLGATRTVQESGVDLSRRAVDAYLDAVTEVDGDGEEARVAVEEAFEAVEEVHDEAWTAFERVVEEADRSAADLSDAQRETVEAAFDALLAAQADAEAAAGEAADPVDIDVDET